MRYPFVSRQSGFTLIEMAIVLVIIGLLIGGVLVGAQMVRQSEIRATIAQIDQYTQGMRIFMDRYSQLPGDFNGAEAYWGSDSSCPTTSFNQVLKTATCNGQGLGTLPAFNATTNTYEWYRAWQHMADAGVISGQFSGVGGYVAGTKLAGYSIPASAYPGGGFTLTYYPYSYSSTNDNFPSKAHHVFEVGTVDPACNGGSTPSQCITHSPLFSAMDAIDIDTKLDDGLPGSGMVMSHASASGTSLNPNCTTSAVASTAAYNTSYKGPACALIIDTGY